MQEFIEIIKQVPPVAWATLAAYLLGEWRGRSHSNETARSIRSTEINKI